MRVAGPSLAVSLLLIAAPAFAQGGDYYNYNTGNPYNRQMNQDRYDRYEYYPPQGQAWHGPMQQGQMQSGPMQGTMQNHQRMMQQGMQGGYPPNTNTNIVTPATQGHQPIAGSKRV